MKNKKNNLDNTLPEDLTGVVEFNDTTNKCSVENKTSDNDRAGIDRTSANFSSEPKPKTKKEQHVMLDDAQKTAIAAMVKSLLAEKDAAEKVEAKFSAIEGEKADLKDKLVAADTANSELSKTLEEVNVKLTEASEKVGTLATENEKLAEEAKTSAEELSEIKASQTLDSRKSELTEAGLLLPEGDKQEKQLDKVKSMDDEAFASYKEELKEIADLSKAATEESDNKAKDEEKAKASKEEEGSDKFDKAVASIEKADVSDGEKYQSAIAALNSEVSLDDSKVDVYANM